MRPGVIQPRDKERFVANGDVGSPIGFGMVSQERALPNGGENGSSEGGLEILHPLEVNEAVPRGALR